MDEPLRLTVLRGHPDPAELAAVVTVLLAVLRAAGPEEEVNGAPRAGWGRTGPYRSPVAWKAR
ncbi:acyl-CoA carboxylase subunit epsilon [Streptomyces sp. Da 82-17]|uniref:acyl-CoA carboxylase subunit epsilon n=1 Tax=Streptomyces sp. Da 82-17 TaxID=3377116 RepID=UPI0038D3AAA3